jgi:hypothetical protein
MYDPPKLLDVVALLEAVSDHGLRRLHHGDLSRATRRPGHTIPGINLQPWRDGGAIIPLRNASFSPVARFMAYTAGMKGT